MVIPEKLKLNKFKLVVMPRNADYFARFGSSTPSESVYGGDENPSRQESKLDQLNRTMDLSFHLDDSGQSRRN